MTQSESGRIIPLDILTKAMDDYLHQKDAPQTYGEWQAVEFGQYINRVPRPRFDSNDICYSDIIFRNVESDAYYRATIYHNMQRIILNDQHKVVRVRRKMVPVYEEI